MFGDSNLGRARPPRRRCGPVRKSPSRCGRASPGADVGEAVSAGADVADADGGDMAASTEAMGTDLDWAAELVAVVAERVYVED